MKILGLGKLSRNSFVSNLCSSITRCVNARENEDSFKIEINQLNNYLKNNSDVKKFFEERYKIDTSADSFYDTFVNRMLDLAKNGTFDAPINQKIEAEFVSYFPEDEKKAA